MIISGLSQAREWDFICEWVITDIYVQLLLSWKGSDGKTKILIILTICSFSVYFWKSWVPSKIRSTPTPLPFLPDSFQAMVNTPGMQGKILTFQASFEGVSKTLKGARWRADHSTKFMITLAKAAGLCSEKVVMAEKKSPFSLSAAGLV